MKPLLLTSALLALSTFAAAQSSTPAAGPGLTLVAPAIEDGGIIPPKFTQLSPQPVAKGSTFARFHR